MKTVAKYAGLGFLIGIVIIHMIAIIEGNPLMVSQQFVKRMGSIRAAMMTQTLLSGVYGMLCMGTVIIYESDRLSLLFVTIFHCMICVLPFIPLALFLGWFENKSGVLMVTGIQLGAYFVVWLIMYIRYRMEIKELNRMQKRILERTGT